MPIRTAIVTDPIDVSSCLSEESGVAGAQVVFLGRVRNEHEGKRVRGLFYETYEPMAVDELRSLCAEALESFGLTDVGIIHRVGHLLLGEASVLLWASSPHRDEAFRASRFLIEEIKKRVPIWKREEYVDSPRNWLDGVQS